MSSEYRQVSEDVYYTDGSLAFGDAPCVSFLKEKASLSSRQRARLCFHGNPNDTLHDMLIVMRGGAYIRPHKHAEKSESFCVLEGWGYLCTFDDAGKPPSRTISYCPNGEGGRFFYRMPTGLYHTQFIMSDWLVYLEATNGPFSADSSTFAPWAPTEDGGSDVEKFVENAMTFLNGRETPA